MDLASGGSLAGLIAQRALVVAAPVRDGKSLEGVIAARPTAGFDARVPQSAQTAERFIKWVCTEVKKG